MSDLINLEEVFCQAVCKETCPISACFGEEIIKQLIFTIFIVSLGTAALAAEELMSFQTDGFYQLKNAAVCLARKSTAREVELKGCDPADPYQLWRFEPVVYKER